MHNRSMKGCFQCHNQLEPVFDTSKVNTNNNFHQTISDAAVRIYSVASESRIRFICNKQISKMRLE